MELFKGPSLFRNASIMAIIAGAIAAGLDVALDLFDGIMTIAGSVILFVGIILLISGQVWSSAAQAKEVKFLSYFIIIGSIITMVSAVVGIVGGFGMVPLLIGGAVMILLGFLMWPCICCQSEKTNKSKVVGVAASHGSITITEISQISGLSSDVVRTILYDAIGKREISGRMDGDTFKRSTPGAPTAVTHSTTTEREIVKVLVICPYCGAKTEQGLTKCQNCKADL